ARNSIIPRLLSFPSGLDLFLNSAQAQEEHIQGSDSLQVYSASCNQTALDFIDEDIK
ncbi:Uncharacterized protein DAT39_003854, partial [Clarias magur]